jgi:broad specificity phosphatase PhoE
MRTLLSAAFLLLASCAIATAPVPSDADSRAIHVVRHLEKAAEPAADPPLTPAGAARARALAELLADRGIEAIFVSDTRRARETALPLSERIGIGLTVYDPARPAELAGLVEATGGNLLVVGHSNTVPDLVERFGGTRPAPIADDEYGTIWVIEGGATRTLAIP